MSAAIKGIECGKPTAHPASGNGLAACNHWLRGPTSSRLIAPSQGAVGWDLVLTRRLYDVAVGE